MNTERNLPNDAVHGIAGLAFTIAWHVSILGLLIAIATLLLVPRAALFATVGADRAQQRRDAFPVGAGWWGAESARPPPAARQASAPPGPTMAGDVVMTAYRAHAPRLQPLFDRIGIYGLLIRQRLPLLAGLVPGLCAMAWCAWGFGAHLYALGAADGTPLSTLSYRYWRMALGACCATFFSFPFWPVPLSSWILLLPIGGLMLAVVYTRRWRAP